MVMVIFKPRTDIQSDIKLQKISDFEKYGRELWNKYSDIKEQLVINCGNLELKQICEIALGLVLADYQFDKYESKKPEDYAILESVIFVNDKYSELQKLFENYAALANAIRFAKDLYNEPEGLYQTEQYYFEIKRLEYLGLEFKDCGNNLLRLVWKGNETGKEQIIVARNRKSVAVAAGVIKAIALQKRNINLTVYLQIEDVINDLLVKSPIYINENIIDEFMAEQELRRVYNLIEEN